jgi:hypothetical protein
MALAGGTTPMILTYLIDSTKNLNMPVILLMSYAVLTTLLLRVSKEIKTRKDEHIHQQAA